ncbi:MAG: peroxidase, FMP-type [Sediminibacterium sp.]
MSNSKEKQKSSVKPYPEWNEGLPNTDNPTNGAQFGILSKLHGTWVNWKGGPTGLHTTPMPSPGTSSETIFGIFHFKSQAYREQLKFTQVNAPVRNRGGSNEQFNGAVKYETAIIDNDNALQHFENGMYLWLGQNQMPWDDKTPYQNPRSLFSHKSDEKSVEIDGAEPVLGPGQLGPQFVPPYTISRSGVIPHGTTIHLMGNFKSVDLDKDKGVEGFEIAPLWDPASLSISPTMGIQAQAPGDGPTLIPNSREKPEWTKLPREDQSPGGGPEESGVNSARAYFEKIFNYDQFGAKFPYTVQPNLKLTDANNKLKFKRYDLIELDTQHPTGLQGSTANNVMIDRYCKVVRMQFKMWLEEVYDEETQKWIDQLQYQQIVFFEFMFGSNGSTTQWPHIQVNTLRREQDIPRDKRLPAIHLPTEAAKEVTDGPKPIVCPMGHTRG